MPLEDVKAEPKKQRFLDRTFTMLEARTGTKFQPGRSDVQVMRLTLDRVNVVSRPFFIYAIANSLNWYLRTKLYPSRGVGLYREGNIEWVLWGDGADWSYFVRIPPGWTPEKATKERNSIPIVYMHGLGFGLVGRVLLSLTAVPKPPACQAPGSLPPHAPDPPPAGAPHRAGYLRLASFETMDTS